MKTPTSEIVIWTGGIVLAGLLAFSTYLGPRPEPGRVQELCNPAKAFVADVAVKDILSEIAAPAKILVGPEDPVASYKGDCVFHVAGIARVTDASGTQRNTTFEGDIKLYPIPVVWKNVSVRIR